MTSPFYSRTLHFHPLPVVNAVNIFRNDKKVYLQSKARIPTANWPVSAIFILWFCNNKKTAGQYIVNLVGNKVYAKRGGRRFSMFISENICAMVDLFDKAVAEGARLITVETRSFSN